jgi:hypothetical protein
MKNDEPAEENKKDTTKPQLYSQSTLKRSFYSSRRHGVPRLRCSEVSRRHAVSGTVAQTKATGQRTGLKLFHYIKHHDY